jgi:hypothetical protein
LWSFGFSRVDGYRRFVEEILLYFQFFENLHYSREANIRSGGQEVPASHVATRCPCAQLIKHYAMKAYGGVDV